MDQVVLSKVKFVRTDYTVKTKTGEIVKAGISLIQAAKDLAAAEGVLKTILPGYGLLDSLNDVV